MPCHRAPGTGPAADLDAQGPPTARSQVDRFFHPEDPYETTEGPTGRFPPHVPRWSPGYNPNRLPQCFRRTGPRTCSIFHNWTPLLLEKVVVLALGLGVRRAWARTDLFRSFDLGDEIREVDLQTDFSIHFKQSRWTLPFPRTVAVGTRPSVPSLGWWRSTLVSDALL